jgi:hydroxylaminobenzene mutase
MLLFLLALFVGLAVPKFALPRLALSTHLLGIMQGTFLLVAGSLWPRPAHALAVSGAASPSMAASA